MSFFVFENITCLLNSGKHVSFSNIQNVLKDGVDLQYLSWSSLSIPPFISELFNGITKDGFETFVRLIPEQVRANRISLGSKTKI